MGARGSGCGVLDAFRLTLQFLYGDLSLVL